MSSNILPPAPDPKVVDIKLMQRGRVCRGQMKHVARSWLTALVSVKRERDGYP